MAGVVERPSEVTDAPSDAAPSEAAISKSGPEMRESLPSATRRLEAGTCLAAAMRRMNDARISRTAEAVSVTGCDGSRSDATPRTSDPFCKCVSVERVTAHAVGGIGGDESERGGVEGGFWIRQRVDDGIANGGMKRQVSAALVGRPRYGRTDWRTKVG